MRESYIEAECCKYAKTLDWETIKLYAFNNKGLPDRVFLKNGLAFFIEFKKPGEKPTKKQLYVHRKLRKKGFFVYVADNINTGKNAIDRMNEHVVKES